MEFKQLGKYEIVAKIGQGAMGEVFRAHDPVLGRDVAIKTMAAGVGADDELRQRFRREAQSAARLNHPNIITVHDFGEEQGHIYMAMELLEGNDLKDLIVSRAPMSLEQKLSLMEQICDGLAFAHARDVVHRDLKPANIHILAGGQVKIMDFGLARISSSDMTRAGVIMGTPNYMSPEQVRGEKATTRSDVFSLGAVFYELLGGRKPFDADSLAAILYQVMQIQPDPLDEIRPDLPLELCRVIGRAMSKDARLRYANGSEMREAFREIRSAVLGARTAETQQAPAPLPTRRASELAEVTRVSRDATALQPASQYPETLVEQQSTLSGKASTQIPPSTPRRRPPPDRTELLEVARPSPPQSSRGLLYGGGAVAGVVALGALAFLAYQRIPPAPVMVTPPPTAVSAPSPLTTAPPALPLEGMRARLRDKDYRAVASQAREVLRLEPGNDEAKQASEEAERALRAIGAATDRVREALDAGDTDRASRALEGLAALDPRGPDTTALATRLADANRARAQARAALQRAQTAVSTPPSTVAHAIPTPTAVPPTAPPATQPAPPAPTLPAAPPPLSEAATKQAIRGVLDEYRQSFESRNADALKAVQPGVGYEQMKQVFASVTSYGVKLDVDSVTVNGNTALARCVVTYSPVPKPAGGKIKPVPTIFHLKKAGDVWLIERLEKIEK